MPSNPSDTNRSDLPKNKFDKIKVIYFELRSTLPRTFSDVNCLLLAKHIFKTYEQQDRLTREIEKAENKPRVLLAVDELMNRPLYEALLAEPCIIKLTYNSSSEGLTLLQPRETRLIASEVRWPGKPAMD